MRTTRADDGSMLRKSRSSTNLASSASAPARLHARRSAAHHDEREQGSALGGVRLALGLLEGDEDPLADAHGVAERLEAGGDALPVGVPEVRRHRAAGHDEEVPADGGAVVEGYLALYEVDAGDASHVDGGVRLALQDGANGLGDLGRREAGHRDLVEKRLEGVVVRAVEQGDPHRRVRERLRRGQAAEAAPDDDDVRASVHAQYVGPNWMVTSPKRIRERGRPRPRSRRSRPGAPPRAARRRSRCRAARPRPASRRGRCTRAHGRASREGW